MSAMMSVIHGELIFAGTSREDAHVSNMIKLPFTFAHVVLWEGISSCFWPEAENLSSSYVRVEATEAATP
eukprot:2108328-Amphidinium_carterae.1